MWKKWNSSSCGEISCIEIWNFSTWQIFSPPTCSWSRWQISGMQSGTYLTKQARVKTPQNQASLSLKVAPNHPGKRWDPPSLLIHIFSVWDWQNTRDNICYLVVMDDNFSESGINVNVTLRNTNNEGEKSNKCNQCNYASSQACSLKRHLITHSGEKLNNPM